MPSTPDNQVVNNPSVPRGTLHSATPPHHVPRGTFPQIVPPSHPLNIYPFPSSPQLLLLLHSPPHLPQIPTPDTLGFRIKTHEQSHWSGQPEGRRGQNHDRHQ